MTTTPPDPRRPLKNATVYENAGGVERAEWEDQQGTRFALQREYYYRDPQQSFFNKGRDPFIWIRHSSYGGYQLAATEQLPCPPNAYRPKKIKEAAWPRSTSWPNEEETWSESVDHCFPRFEHQWWLPPHYPPQHLYQGKSAQEVAQRFGVVGNWLADYYASRLTKPQFGEPPFSLRNDIVDYEVGPNGKLDEDRVLGYEREPSGYLNIHDRGNNSTVDGVVGQKGREEPTTRIFEVWGGETDIQRELLGKFRNFLNRVPQESHYHFSGKPVQVHVSEKSVVNAGEPLFDVVIRGKRQTIRADRGGQVTSIWQTDGNFNLTLEHRKSKS